MTRALSVAGSYAVSVLRLGAGLAADGAGARPRERLELYEFEACPFCRKVREALTALDLDVLVRPCPKRGERFRPVVRERGGKAQFPYLVDADAGVALYESDDIVAHLYARYGRGAPPLALRLGPLGDLASTLAGVPRAARGGFARPSRAPAQPLELWSFEASPYCRLVRETLCELELPYVLRNVGRGGAARDELRGLAGRVQVPFLRDANTGAAMLESADIVAYLEREYARA
ncbi:MAG: glutathione S-transferase N-terminal domain-containing protein [Myxococcota bacterium]|nr:glutathione S-transferase N-terminal domain-containing protein [Myxococcales bacterium]